MAYAIKEVNKNSFDVFANDDFLQNVIVYNLNDKYDGFANILAELRELGKNITQREFKDLDKFSLKLGFDKHIEDKEYYKIHDALYQKIYTLFKKGFYDNLL